MKRTAMRTEKLHMLLGPFDPTCPYILVVFCLCDIDKNIFCRGRDPTRLWPHVPDHAHVVEVMGREVVSCIIFRFKNPHIDDRSGQNLRKIPTIAVVLYQFGGWSIDFVVKLESKENGIGSPYCSISASDMSVYPIT
jgi:hypothetical protein